MSGMEKIPDFAAGREKFMIYKFLYDEKTPFLNGHLKLGGRNGDTNIEVSNRYLIRGGECWIPIMGEFHYSRVAFCDWKRELLKMKAGGITVVSTYVIWIYHEETEGNFDFHGNNDLGRFVQTVQECGLQIVLRIGPWIHGEVRNGGFPDWLLKKSCALRTDNSEYLEYVRIFYTKIAEQVRQFLFDQGGPVVGIQIENELPHNGGHLLTLKKLAMEVGLTAPIYTVTGWNAKYGAEIPEYDVLPVFGGYPEATWEQHTHELEPSSNYFFQPSRNDSVIGKDLLEKGDDEESVFHMRYELYPFATCELGGGMQVTHHRRPVISGNDVAAIALVKLGSGNNMPGYYMYHGGTNAIGRDSTFQESKASKYPNDLPVRSYDFQAPIGEFGQIRDQYRKLKMQHLFLNHFGREFGKMEPYFQIPQIDSIHDCTALRYALRTDGTGGFVFVNNYRRLHPLPKFTNVQFEVPVDGKMEFFPNHGFTIPSGACFILPYHLDLGGRILEYSTTQLLAREGQTWFFFAPDGISPEYVFSNRRYDAVIPGRHSALRVESETGKDITIVTLTQDQAEHFYELEGEFYLTEGDLYHENGNVVVYREGDCGLAYERWENGGFKKYKSSVEPVEIEVQAVPLKHVETDGYGLEETTLSGPGKRMMWEITVKKKAQEQVEDVFLKIEYTGDLAQIYVDGVLAADDFNKGIPWMVSLKTLKRMGERLELLICERKGRDVYMEGWEKEGLELQKIEGVPLYRRADAGLIKYRTGKGGKE